MMVQAKDCEILNFSLFGGKLWFPGQKQCLGYNTKYHGMRSDFKNKIQAKNCDVLNFSLFGGKLWFPG